MNYVSFSLFGKDPKYLVGAVKNVSLANKFYPGWQCVFWCDKDVPDDCVSQLGKLGATVKSEADIPSVMPWHSQGKMCWRFLANDLPDCNRFLVRDADSRIGEREKAAVEQWIVSLKTFHIMRDHPHHDAPMVGCSWGMRRGPIPSMAALFEWIGTNLPDVRLKGNEAFLARYLYPMARLSALEHDSFHRKLYPQALPFPTARVDGEFVGEIWDENDRRNEGHRKMLLEAEAQMAKSQEQNASALSP